MFKSVDWTATYFQGCNHDCVYCWTKFMPGGPISHVPRLMQTDEHQIIKGKTGICFLNSAHDTFAACIPDSWIMAQLRWIGRQPEGLVFYLQSQNLWRAQGYMPWLKKLQDRIIIGTTIQTNDEELVKSVSNAPSIFSRYQCMLRFGVEGFRLRLALEPLFKFNLRNLRDMVFDIKPELVEVGLDNYAHRHKVKIPQSDLKPYKILYEEIVDFGIPVFEKESIEKWRKTGKR